MLEVYLNLGKMKTNEKGKTLIKNYEGCRLTAYKCPAGIWTIGYGHTGSHVKEGMKISVAEAERLLTEDLHKFENGVSSYVKVPLNENQFSALVSFAFNCGLGSLQTSTLLKKLNAKDYSGAADELLRWDKANGKPLAGLTKRRKAERELFLASVNTPETTNKLPYKVRTTAILNIRTAPTTNAKILLTVPKGAELTVWAEETVDGRKWGKNGIQYFCLDYVERV